MTPLVALAERFHFNDRFLDQLTSDFADKDWLARHGEANHAQWLLGHLACTRRWALRELGAGVSAEPWEQHFGQGCRPSPLSDDIAPALLREALIKNGEKLRKFLVTRTPEQAEAPFMPFPDGSRTMQAGAHFLHFHESYHLGQIGLLRRLQGKPGLI
ncbi:MAG: DinB family protein [Planctomycetota bacterium]